MSRCYNIATLALQMAPKVQGTRNDSIHQVPPSFLSAKTLQHCKHTGLNQAYFTRSLIINTFFASLPGVNFIRKKARVCGSIASLLYAVCLYRAYGHWTLTLHIYIMNSCLKWPHLVTTRHLWSLAVQALKTGNSDTCMEMLWLLKCDSKLAMYQLLTFENISRVKFSRLSKKLEILEIGALEKFQLCGIQFELSTVCFYRL